MAKAKRRDKVVVKPMKRKEVALNRLHSAEAALAGSRIREAGLQLAQAQQGLREAYEAASQTSKAILREMHLSLDNLVDIDALVVRPPQGQEYVVEQDA